MKLLVVGANSTYSIERFYLKYWKEYGTNITIEFFPAQNFFYEYYNKNIINKIVFKFGISSIYDKINFKLIRKVDEFQPDIIIVCAGYDALSSDDLSNLMLHPNDYRIISQHLKDNFGEKIIFGLEGGYNIKELPFAIKETILPFT